MTVKSQMIAALKGELPDQIPFIPRLELWYTACQAKNSLPEQYRDTSVEDIARAEGWGIYRITTNGSKNIDFPEELPFYALGVYAPQESPYRLSFGSEIEVETQIMGDGEIRVVFHTPKGSLNAVVVLNQEMLCNGITHPWVKEMPIKTFTDWDKMTCLFDNLIVSPRHEPLAQIQELIGEDGIAGSVAADPASPMHLIQKYLFSPTDFFIYYRERRKQLDALADSVSNFFEQVLNAYDNSDAELISWGGNFDRTITFAPYFKKDILPWCIKAYDRLKKDNNFILTHTDGENYGLMELLLETKMDGFESLCPFPLTQLKLHEYREQWRERVLIGGIPAEYLIPESTSPEQMLAYMDYLFATIAPGDRFIVGVTDAVSPLSDFDRLRRLGDCVRKNHTTPLKKKTIVDIFKDQIVPKQTHVSMAYSEGELNLLQNAIIKGQKDDTVKSVKKSLELQLPPQEILDKGMIRAMNYVGDAFARGEMFIPEMLLAAQAMEQGVSELQPALLATGKVKQSGKIILGTVKGDHHDIGKNLVGIMLRSVGLTVIDVGINVDVDHFLQEAMQHQADMIALSALLTTTMPQMKLVVQAVIEAGLRDKIKIIVGGAPVTEGFAKQIGADGYAVTAGEAANLAQQLLV